MTHHHGTITEEQFAKIQKKVASIAEIPSGIGTREASCKIESAS